MKDLGTKSPRTALSRTAFVCASFAGAAQAQFVVINANSSGAGSLAQAIINANAKPRLDRHLQPVGESSPSPAPYRRSVPMSALTAPVHRA